MPASPLLLRSEIHAAADRLTGDSLTALHAVALALQSTPVVMPRRKPTEIEIVARARTMANTDEVCGICGFKSRGPHPLFRHIKRNHWPRLIEMVQLGE